MKKRYFDLMERALSAYSEDHIHRYFNDVQTNGLTEHGFPRLTANIGILISDGRRRDLLPIFLEMMDFCCRTIPTVKAANDFSVREIVCCLSEVETAGVVEPKRIEQWKSDLRSIDPETCYNRLAKTPTDYYRNWVLFTAVSEYFRQEAGLCDSTELIELQLLQQLQWFDENGMYRDNTKEDTRYQPMVYDLVPRGLLCLLLNRGYRGAHYGRIDALLKKAGLLSLDMQSPTGELAFGGRSNQFLHNEPWLSVIFEFEARRYAKEGDLALAARFKAASARAIAVTEEWLSKEPIRHIKNRYPTETGYGCEDYAYFDKYMITVASFLYAAHLICDDSIPTGDLHDVSPCVAQTSHHFHKLFLKCGGYGAELDLNADPSYDASGLGRVQREGAPSAICLSCPCPADPHYTVDIEHPFALSLRSVSPQENGWDTRADGAYEVINTEKTESAAKATLLCRHLSDACTTEEYTVSADGVCVTVRGEGEIGYSLPAFCYDGESAPDVTHDGSTLTISYEGWVCRYTTDGTVVDTGMIAANRNGHYRAYLARSRHALTVKIEILKK